MKYLSKLSAKYLTDKTCLLRVNLDVMEPKEDSLRLNAVVPTIKYLLKNGSKVLIIGHRGRPVSKDPKLSVEPCVRVLEKKVGQQLEWLENLRFDPREQAGDKSLAKELAEKGDFFVNDDFATLHHTDSSFMNLPKYLPSFAGLLIEKEIEILSKIKNNSKKPLIVVIGGVKFDDKVEVIENLKKNTDYFLMGSAYIDLDHPALKSKKVILPVDWLGNDSKKLDIGPKTINKYQEVISKAKTVIWNGPVGQFEKDEYRKGSKSVAWAIINSGAFSVIGGGDTEEMLDLLGLKNKFSFVSTGGGAMLTFLADKKLSGLEALEKSK